MAEKGENSSEKEQGQHNQSTEDKAFGNNKEGESVSSDETETTDSQKDLNETKQDAPESPDSGGEGDKPDRNYDDEGDDDKRRSEIKKNTKIIPAAAGGAAAVAIVVAILVLNPMGQDGIGDDNPLTGGQEQPSAPGGGEESSFLEVGSEDKQNKPSKVVVAEVNDEDITMGEVNDMKERLQRSSPAARVDNMTALDRMIVQTLLLQEAQKRGIEITSQEAESELGNRLEQGGQTVENFTNRVEQQGESYEEVLGRFGDQLAITELVDKVVGEKDIEIADKDAQKYFEQNKDKILQNVPPKQREQLSYDDVKGQLKQALSRQAQQQTLLEFIEELRNQSDIQVYEDKL